MAPNNLYDVLECSQTASEDDIRRQYKKLALKFHPDKNDSDMDSFDVLKKAYETLSNDETRREYDIELLRKASKESDMIVTDTVPIEELTTDDGFSYYDCRCSGQFLISQPELDDAADNNRPVDAHIQCDSCSLFLHVIGIQQKII